MAKFLKSDTATHIMFGPFVDKTDGVTLEVAAGIITSIDHATTGIFLSKNGGAGAIRNQNVTDTNTPGTLRVMMAEAATFLPVHDDYMVIPHELWDTLFVTQPAVAINKFFDVASSVLTCASVNQVQDNATTAEIATAVWQDTTAGDFTTGSSIGKSLFTSGNAPGAASGLAIVGSSMVVPNTQKVDVETIKTQAVTCAAGVTVLPSVGAAAAQTATLDTIKADTAAILTDTGTTLDGRIPAALGADGFMKASLFGAMGTALTETAGLIAAAIVKFFNIATPTGTVNEIKANVKKVNDVALTGDGSATPWGPA